jgi:hypothetical protein
VSLRSFVRPLGRSATPRDPEIVRPAPLVPSCPPSRVLGRVRGMLLAVVALPAAHGREARAKPDAIRSLAVPRRAALGKAGGERARQARAQGQGALGQCRRHATEALGKGRLRLVGEGNTCQDRRPHRSSFRLVAGTGSGEASASDRRMADRSAIATGKRTGAADKDLKSEGRGDQDKGTLKKKAPSKTCWASCPQRTRAKCLARQPRSHGA